MRSTINLYNEDCLPAMRKMADNQYDLAIVDPDFGLNEKISSGGTWASKYKKGDGFLGGKPTKEYFDQLFRISKNQIIWGANYFSDIPTCRGFIIWDKKLTDNWTLAMAEMAYCSIDMPSKIFRASLSEGVQKEGKRIHICQKPIKLYKWLLKNYAKPGDKILDTHGGSMSIGIACWDAGYDLDAYEIDKDYFEAGKKRLEVHKAQLQIY